MILELRHVDCGYGKDNVILKDVNFKIESGEICCLLGPNGVGKSTLFRTILNLMPCLDGEVRVDNEDLAKWSVKRRAKMLSYVSQSHIPPFPYRVKEVVLLGRLNHFGYFAQPTDQDHQVVEEALHDLGISHLRDKIYVDISGGERQMVMIARALAQETKFLVLDEPTANLDYGNMVKVISKIRKLKEKGLGIIMTTHVPDHAFMCDAKVVLLQRDRPLLFGSAAEIVTEKNLKDAYGVHIKVFEFYNDQGRQVRMCQPQFDED